MNLSQAPQSENEMLRHYIEERQISDSLQDELLRFSGEERSIICSLVRELRPSGNTMRELLGLISEICQRDGLRWTDLFSESPAKAVFADDCKLSSKDRHRELKNFLTRKRFPETSRIQEELDSLRKQIARDCSLSVKLPPNLEGENIELLLSFDSIEELSDLSKKLATLKGHPALEKIFSILKGES